MATEAQIIEKVRRAVADYKEPVFFEKSFYQDAVEFALSKLNHDFGATYATVPDVPTNKVFLLLKLATIQMAFARAAQIMDSENDPSNTSVGGISQIQVPDLLISGADDSDARSAMTWLDLANRLQAEYDGELEHSGGSSQAAELQLATIHKVSLHHGGFINRKMDPGLAAVSVAATVSGTTVSLEWDTLYANDFMQYEVYRGTASDMSDEERIATIGDNHDTDYEDEELATGTYYYRVKTVNYNELKTNSNIVEAIV